MSMFANVPHTGESAYINCTRGVLNLCYTHWTRCLLIHVDSNIRFESRYTSFQFDAQVYLFYFVFLNVPRDGRSENERS